LAGLAAAVAATLCSATPAAASTAGALDTTFGNGGFSNVPLGTWGGAAAAAVQPDGKIVTVGEGEINGSNQVVSTRMNRDGSLDTGFGNGGTVIVDIGGAAGGNAIHLQSDGKILLAGTGNGNGALDFAVVQLLPNGNPDAAFGNQGIATVPIGVSAIANGVAVQPDGKIVLGGTALVGSNHFAVARLNANGTIDSTFGSQGSTTLGPPSAAWGMVLQPDGKIVLAGEDGTSASDPYLAARVLPNGSLDPSFGQGGTVTVPIGAKAFCDAIALQPDGKIILTGNAFTNTGVAATVRLNANGSLDGSFGSSGVATLGPFWNAVNAITLDASGRILLAATGASAVRINGDGTADQGFGTGGIVTAQVGTATAANGVAVQASDGKIVLSGVATVAGRAVLSVIRLAADPVASNPIVPVVGAVGGVASVIQRLLAPVPSNTGPPIISGTATEGHTLSSTRGAWSQSPNSFAYQWQDCDTTGNYCRDIAGATHSAYTLLGVDHSPGRVTGGDIGHTVRVVVTASNANGSSAATSYTTATVTGHRTAAGPAMWGVGLASSSFTAKRGTRITITVSESATITVAITHNVRGYKVRGTCRARGTRGTRCTLTARMSTLSFYAVGGHNTFAFRIPGLRPGRYAGTVTARNATGRTSRPLTIGFAVR
jgi:uncharacterized delta-60 repeat protein